MTAKDATAHPHDHRPVPPDERLKGDVVALADECVQKLFVGQAHRIAQKHESAQMLNDSFRLAQCHSVPFVDASSSA